MDGYCFRCGRFTVIDALICWCRACLDAWEPEDRRTG